jgi:hypothetical protein
MFKFKVRSELFEIHVCGTRQGLSESKIDHINEKPKLMLDISEGYG